MLVQNILDFARIYVVPTSDNDILLAVDYVQEAITVFPGDIAGVKPTVSYRLTGLGRAILVSFHYDISADGQFADFVRSCLVI